MTSKSSERNTRNRSRLPKNRGTTKLQENRKTQTLNNELSVGTLAVLVVIGAVLVGVVSALGEIGNAWVDAFNLSSSASVKVWIFLATVAIVGGIIASLMGRKDLRKH